MGKYYLIPVTESDVLYNGKTLIQHLQENYNKLYQSEKERLNILYATNPFMPMPLPYKAKYTKNGIKTKKLYGNANIPTQLICYGCDSFVCEIATGNLLEFTNNKDHKSREVTYETVQDYYLSSNYVRNTINYFGEITKTESKVLLKK